MPFDPKGFHNVTILPPTDDPGGGPRRIVVTMPGWRSGRRTRTLHRRMIGIRRTHPMRKTALALCLAMVPLAAQATASDAQLTAMMHGWHQAMDECRGSYPDDPAHPGWCHKEADLAASLNAEGCRLVALGTSIDSARWACPRSVMGDQG
jgi:hypothetical protein